MSDLYIGQNYSSHVGSSNNSTTGNAGGFADGVNWPYDPSGATPNINYDPNKSAAQNEAAYEELVQYLRAHPGDYNGYIRLLQMTLDMGQHGLGNFISEQLKSGDKFLFKMIVEAAFEGAAVSQKDGASGEAAAKAFLHEIMNACAGLQGIPVFNTIYSTAAGALNDSNPEGVNAWIASHWVGVPNGATGKDVDTWVDDNGVPIKNFSQFAGMAAFSLGIALVGDGSNVNSVIDSFYENQIEALVKEFKGNPWALMIALMNLINQRDKDDGISINGYGDNLSTLKGANALIEELLGDISSKPNAKDFFAVLNKLKTMVEQNPALSKLVGQLQSDIDTICKQDASGQERVSTQSGDFQWTAGPGRYHFPPGTKVYVNGKEITVPADGWVTIDKTSQMGAQAPHGSFSIEELKAMGDEQATKQPNGMYHYFYEWTNSTTGFYHFPAGSDVWINGREVHVPPSGEVYIPAGAKIRVNPKQGTNFNFGDLAGMGDTQDIDKAMGSWSNTVMSNFENGVTGIQTLLNGASPAIQQQMQTMTQTMQARENFEKQAFSSITSMNQQIMRMIQQVMG